LHIDFIPFVTGSKRGLDTRVSLKGALERMGFKGGSRGETEWNQWMESEKQALSKVMERHGIKWKQLGTKEKHLSVLDYEKKERQKEVAALDGEIERIAKETKQIKSDNQTLSTQGTLLSSRKQLLELAVERLAEEKDRLNKSNQAMEVKSQEIRQELERLSEEKKFLALQTGEFNTGVWALTEPDKWETAKSYRDTKVKPLVEKFRKAIKSLRRECDRLKEELTETVNLYKDRIASLIRKNEEQEETINQLQEKADDLDRVRKVAGDDKVDWMIASAKRQEQADKAREYRYQPVR
jgi:chromosome segregation ATPase